MAKLATYEGPYKRVTVTGDVIVETLTDGTYRAVHGIEMTQGLPENSMLIGVEYEGPKNWVHFIFRNHAFEHVRCNHYWEIPQIQPVFRNIYENTEDF